MAWKVIKPFYDLHDGNYYYSEGDTFPRKGKAVSQERLAVLSSDKNLQKTPLIAEVKKATKKKGD